MIKNAAERIKSIEIALANELRERDFYLQHSERTKNPLGKKMFTAIADDEHEHYQRLQALHAQLSQQGKWAETVPLTVTGTCVQEVLEDLVGSVKKDAPADIDDQEAVKIAIDFEEKGYRFYSDLRDAVEDATEKGFYALLAQIEMEHFLSLKETLLFFEDPASWFANQEKPHLDGG